MNEDLLPISSNEGTESRLLTETVEPLWTKDNGTNVKEVDFWDYLNRDGIDVIEFGDNAVTVVEHPVELREQPRLPEMGTTSSKYTNYTREEYNPELRGIRGLQKYERMAKSDTAVRASLRTLTTPITGGVWFIEPATNSPKDKEIAKFIQLNINKWMTYNWDVIVPEALKMLTYGHYVFEKVWDFREYQGKQMVYLRKLASRHPMHIVEDGWNLDKHGGPKSIDFYGYPGTPDHVRIPIKKLLIFTFDGEGGDLQGVSLLRSAYKHWFFKENAYKIDAIQKERHGIGIPIIKLNPGFTDADKAKAQELGANLRTNERAHVVLPPHWEIMFAKLEGQPVSALETANHHAGMIYHNVLGQGMWTGNASSGESTQNQMEMFYKSTRHIANLIRTIFNQYVIPELVDYNWDVEEYPEMKVRRLGDTAEARDISFAVRNFVGANIIQVDDQLEAWARDTLDAPKFDETTLRVVETPQAADKTSAKAGPPRQSKAKDMKNNPDKSAGTDGKGGS